MSHPLCVAGFGSRILPQWTTPKKWSTRHETSTKCQQFVSVYARWYVKQNCVPDLFVLPRLKGFITILNIHWCFFVLLPVEYHKSAATTKKRRLAERRTRATTRQRVLTQQRRQKISRPSLQT